MSAHIIIMQLVSFTSKSHIKIKYDIIVVCTIHVVSDDKQCEYVVR